MDCAAWPYFLAVSAGDAGAWGIRVAYYRLYLLAADGRIAGVRECHVDDDEAAISAAVAVDHPHGVAIWQQKRYLGRVDAGRITLAEKQTR